jgi:hypothetical protein
MRRQIGQKSRAFAPALRGFLTVFLMLAYVMVGIAGEVACAEETLAVADRVMVDGGQDKADQGDKKSVAVVDHCYTCVPLLLPLQVLVAEPSAKPATLAFTTPTFLLGDHPGLDTPPPKELT